MESVRVKTWEKRYFGVGAVGVRRFRCKRSGKMPMGFQRHLESLSNRTASCYVWEVVHSIYSKLWRSLPDTTVREVNLSISRSSRLLFSLGHQPTFAGFRSPGNLIVYVCCLQPRWVQPHGGQSSGSGLLIRPSG